MRRTALVLMLIFAGTESTPAQIPRFKDGPDPELLSLNTCDPSGNIDEIPFEPESVPIEDWLRKRETRQIPMEMTIRGPELRMDQQTSVVYLATLHLKNTKAAQDRKVVFFVGVDGADGNRLTETSVHAVSVPPQTRGEFDLSVRGCIYFRPGNYSLWIAAYDESTGKHSVQRQNVRVPELKKDPLPLMESRLPSARFPDYTPEETELSKTIPTTLFLPVSNKRELAVDIISLRPSLRDGIGPLTQMALKDSSISVITLDLDGQKVVYDSRATGAFDFSDMLKAAELHKDDDRTIEVSDLLNRRDGAGYLRKFIEERIKTSDGKMHVTFVLSSPMTFERGADMSAIQLDPNCECRLFHIRLFPFGRDDVEKILKSPLSRRLEVNSALEFRKALAIIVRDLETF